MTDAATQDILSDLRRITARESRDQERRVNTIRACALAALLGVTFYAQFLSPGPSFKVDLITVLSGLAGCLIHFFWNRSRRVSGALIPYFSVLLDIALVTAICLGHAIVRHHNNFGGVGATADMAFLFYPIVIASAAMRFDRNVAYFGTAATTGVVLGLFAYDHLLLGVPWSPLTPLIAIIGILTAGAIARGTVKKSTQLVVGTAKARAEKAHITQTFSRYMAEEVVEEILAGRVSVDKGKRHEVTILFSDIRGFTKMAENMEPEEVVDFLNEYFTEMVDVVLRHGGTIDKFIGDGMMAVFGAPIRHPDHPLRAATAALEMRAALGALNDKRQALGLTPIAIGIGLHTGECVIGNIGSLRRLEYTAIGDTVNTASRIEGITKDLGVDILLTGTTLAWLAGQVDANPLDKVVLRGKTAALDVHHLVGLREKSAVDPNLAPAV